MSSELYQIETRRRSRSKTPFLRSSCDHENCEHAGEEGHLHHKKKTATAPNVQTIIEETVEVTSSSTPLAAKQISKTQHQQVKTSDYYSEDTSPEEKNKKSSTPTFVESNKKQSVAATTTTTSTSSATANIVTRTKKFISAGMSSSTPKHNYLSDSYASQFERREKESTQNDINNAYERLQREQTNKSSTITTAAGAASNLTIGGGNSFGQSAGNAVSLNQSDHIAYMEYKRAGEYWKTTPKTDYTYSELSPHRRELAPGIVAMPNMSRRSLENHQQRIKHMIERNPAQEEFIRRRYESNYTKNRREYYDSGDEVDITNYGKRNNNYNAEDSWFVRLITTIITTITHTWSIMTGGDGGDDVVGANIQNETLYRTSYGVDQQRGFFGSIMHGISSTFLNAFRYVYMFISSVLCLDTMLLRSSDPENKNKKRFLLFLLILLPLLLLAGTYYYLHPNDTFPPKSFSEYTFTLPDLPKFDMSEYVNREKFDAIKLQAYERVENIRDWADDYLLYLKQITKNAADEGRKLFQRETHYERV